jgi:hypothetical protein
MAYVNPPSNFNYNSVTQRGQLQNIQTAMNNVAPGCSVTPPASAMTSATARAQFISQTQRACNQSRGPGGR